MAVKIGLTGGIGSGKSSVASIFTLLGVEVIDADNIAREVTRPGAKALIEITQRFGDQILSPDGQLDRKGLGDIVFSDREQRLWLESLLHPEIRMRMDTQASECPDPYCILEIPLLLESGRHLDMTKVIVVHCPQNIRIQRLKDFRDMRTAAIEGVMQNQASDEERLAIADYVIDNSGDISDLNPQVNKVHDALIQQYGPSSSAR
jgi:dephospho-CoA kinase